MLPLFGIPLGTFLQVWNSLSYRHPGLKKHLGGDIHRKQEVPEPAKLEDYLGFFLLGSCTKI